MQCICVSDSSWFAAILLVFSGADFLTYQITSVRLLYEMKRKLINCSADAESINWKFIYSRKVCTVPGFSDEYADVTSILNSFARPKLPKEWFVHFS